MGLDVYFNVNAAVRAGLEITEQRNGSAADVQEARQEARLTGDFGYVDWLKSSQSVCQLPEKWRVDEYVRNIDFGSDGLAFVRANKWGNFYAPLTKFLADNNIEWGEG